MDLFADDPILPSDEEDMVPIHDREYRVRAYRRSPELMTLRGAVRDQKPPGLYLEMDPDPLTVHHMQLELDIAFPSFEITRAEVTYESHPHETCPGISPHYDKLVGLSIARGFTHRVRELFGGPRGCTHVTALVQAMAPVAIQASWSMRASAARESGTWRLLAGEGGDQAARRAAYAMNLNTCHVWDENGEMVQHLENGGSFGAPVFLRQRLDRFGITVDRWPPLDDQV